MRAFCLAPAALIAMAALGAAQEAPTLASVTTDPVVRGRMMDALFGQDPWMSYLIVRGGENDTGDTIDINGVPHAYVEACQPYACPDQAMAAIITPDKQPHIYAFGGAVEDGPVTPDMPQDILDAFKARTQGR